MFEIRELLKKHGFNIEKTTKEVIFSKKMDIIDIKVEYDIGSNYYDLELRVIGLDYFDLRKTLDVYFASKDKIISIINEYIKALPVEYRTDDEILEESRRRKL